MRWRWAGPLAASGRAGQPPAALDIGCGEGAFLRAARAAGCRTAGIEINPAAAEACRRQGLKITCGSVFEVAVPPGPWDLITFWDVLDQLERPREALHLAARYLAAGGLLIVRGRNARLHAPVKMAVLRLRRLAPALPVHDPAVVHRWGLAPDGYVTLLRAAGLADIRLHPDLSRRRPVRGMAEALHRLSLRRLYPFSSVLISGRKPAGTGERPGTHVPCARGRVDDRPPHL
jgi:SAM-dependent methyltransferase